MLAIVTAAEASIVVGGFATVGTIVTAVISALTRRDAKQLTPNGGSSIADAVRRIERKLDDMDHREQSQGERIAALEALVHRQTGDHR